MSGGLDSVCYAGSLAQSGSDLYTITFDYNQRARPEIQRAKYFAKIIGSREHKVVDISFMQRLYGSSNALTNRKISLAENFNNDLVVPIRNAVFLTIATAWALSMGASKVAYGAHRDDVAHYPDCRPEFVKSLQDSLNLADSDNISLRRHQEISIISPVISGLGKSELLKAGYLLFAERLFKTWSCYSGGLKRGSRLLHCGSCESCINRKNAFKKAQIHDKTGYARE